MTSLRGVGGPSASPSHQLDRIMVWICKLTSWFGMRIFHFLFYHFTGRSGGSIDANRFLCWFRNYLLDCLWSLDMWFRLGYRLSLKALWSVC
jgi:hypothetical protein